MATYRTEVIERADSEVHQQIVKALRAYNTSQVGEFASSPLTLAVRDSENLLIGGLNGLTHFGWLYVQHLWVAEAHQGQGVGRKLLLDAEAIAVNRGCASAYLDTFSSEALAFYKRVGYGEFGALPEFPVGRTRTFLQKKLAPRSQATLARRGGSC